MVRRCLARTRAALCAASYSVSSSGGISARAAFFAAVILPRHAGGAAFGLAEHQATTAPPLH